ncbi:MAG: S1 RNA-binding domain-containing protein [Verrucomicrobium sp.]|nr:S1-like domain-containing RNA-binding protein [Verrucomicrobium sp.]
MAEIGKTNILRVVRQSAQGLYLDGGDLGEILLPKRYAPPSSIPGSDIEVFIYSDSEDRLIATTETPLAKVGDFAFLKVLSFNHRIGAFLDMGLSKDLLLPMSEQDGHVAPGDRIIVHVVLDERSDRIVATMKINRHLNRTKALYADDEAVELLITGETPLGYNAIVENAHWGLLYHSDLNAALQTGQKLRGFIKTVRPDGKIDLRLDASGYQRISPLTQKILEALKKGNGRIDLDDQSPPEAIRYAFGVSKKSFKQAIGALLRERRIRFERGGVHLNEVE